MPFTEQPPAPPPPDVVRFTPDGRATPEQIQYETALRAFLRRLAASIP